jgi:hypothetical protein
METDVDKRLAVHEAVCTERYNAISKSLSDSATRMSKIEYLLYALMVAVLLGPGVAAEMIKKVFGI